MRKIRVVPYDSNWPILHEKEVVRISGVLKKEIIASHHIGSTSIPGMYAKPIIDIMLEVKDITKIDDYNDKMITLGYEPRGELGIPGRRYFSREQPKDVRTHHVHAYQSDNPELIRHLAFRDYMIAHPKDAKIYAELKLTLARRFHWDVDGYILGKEQYVSRMEKIAIKWYRSRKT